MKNTLSSFVLGAIGLLLLGGCGVGIQNHTPKQVSQNSSGMYRLSMKAKLQDGNVKGETIKSSVVINGETYEMQPVAGEKREFFYDYRMPVGQTEAKYYYVVDYDVLLGSENTRLKQDFSEVYELELINRYVVSLENERGVVGSEVAVLGRGFEESDRIFVGGVEAKVNYGSSNAISFIVPALEGEQTYAVELENDNGIIDIGQFLIDNGIIEANVDVLELTPGEQQMIVLRLSSPAPEGGIWLTDETDVPASVIMPEVYIEEGAQTANVRVEGGKMGEGTLYIGGPGFEELELPVIVDEPEGMYVEEDVVLAEAPAPELASVTPAPVSPSSSDDGMNPYL